MLINYKYITIGLVAILFIIGAATVVKINAPQSNIKKELFIENLSDNISSVQNIKISNYRQEVNLWLDGDKWVVKEFDDYPALSQKMASALFGMSDLRVDSAKTKLPRLYHRLGVEGTDIADSRSLQIILTDQNQEVLADVIIGKKRHSSAAQNVSGLYVRKSDEAQSYLVDGQIDISANRVDWINRSLMNVAQEKISRVEVTHSDGDHYVLFKAKQGQSNFDYENLPAGKKLTSEVVINGYASLLSDIQISGVRSTKEISLPEKIITTKIITFDGMLVTYQTFLLNEVPYTTFEFGVSEDVKSPPQGLIDDLQKRLSGWAFAIQPFKYDIIKKRSNELLK